MLAYLAKLRKGDGLFSHTDQSEPHWGRGSGWVAAGMTEILLDLPSGALGDAVVAGYRKQMDGLLKVQLGTGTDPRA